MASSLIRGRYLITPASGGQTTALADAGVYQENGVIREVGPWQEMRALLDPDEELGG